MVYNLYWGDIHSHAYCGGEFSSPEQDLAIAKSHLDFWAPAEHAIGQKPNEERFPDYWTRLRSVLLTNYTPGEFVTILGWEWADCTNWYAGDMCVYFPGEAIDPMPVPREYQQMIEFVRKHGAILIPHHVGYTSPYPGTNWDRFIPDIMPAVEIFSMHGSSERDGGPFPMNLINNGPRATGGTVIDGLERGLKFGIIASTDEHVGYPGMYRQGLMAAYAPELTREAIWEALLQRRTYAITGDRIQLEFSIDGAMMGSELAGLSRREIAIRVSGEDMLNEIDIIKNGRLWKRETRAYEENSLTNRARIRIEWGWGACTWNGEINVLNGRILTVAPHFSPPGPNAILQQDDTLCCWESSTFGNNPFQNSHGFGRYQFLTNTGGNLTSQIVVEIEEDQETRLRLKMNGKDWTFDLCNLLRSSHVLIQEGNTRKPIGNPIGSRKIKIHQAVSSQRYAGEYCFVDNEPERDVDYYYVRLTQSNGQMAWSSPIWVAR